jgi:hypothetical protein
MAVLALGVVDSWVALNVPPPRRCGHDTVGVLPDFDRILYGIAVPVHLPDQKKNGEQTL